MNRLTCEIHCNRALCKISEGDLSALTVVYDCMARRMFALALSILKNYADAEDATQDAFLKVIQSIGTYRKDGNAVAWLLSITRNAAIDRMRKRKDSISVETFFGDAEPSECKDPAERLALEEAFMSLEQEDREILTLKIYGGLKFREISDQMGLPLTTVQKRYQRALQKLKTQLR